MLDGRQTNRDGKPKSANEYDDSVRAREWDRGWEDEQMGIPHNA